MFSKTLNASLVEGSISVDSGSTFTAVNEGELSSQFDAGSDLVLNFEVTKNAGELAIITDIGCYLNQ